MADNLAVRDYLGTAASMATDFVTIDGANVHVQRVKLSLGAANAYDGDLDAGQQSSACSVSVVLASDHAAIATYPASALGLTTAASNAMAVVTPYDSYAAVKPAYQVMSTVGNVYTACANNDVAIWSCSTTGAGVYCRISKVAWGYSSSAVTTAACVQIWTTASTTGAGGSMLAAWYGPTFGSEDFWPEIAINAPTWVLLGAGGTGVVGRLFVWYRPLSSNYL